MHGNFPLYGEVLGAIASNIPAFMIWLSFISFLVSAVSSACVIRWLAGWAGTYSQTNPQRSHLGDVPRFGGLALMSAIMVAWLLGVWQTRGGDPGALELDNSVFGWIVVLLPAAFGGIMEDFTQRLAARWRLLLTLASGVLAVWLLDLNLSRLGLPWLDALLHEIPWLGVGIALLGIAGLPHAFNIIDGYNGLASMVALIVCLALVHVCLQVGDRSLAALLICLAAATVGFLVWNYPLGMLFAGDGGAYVWGVVIAVASLMLVQRHAAVSPWFPMLLLIYPVCETLFSIYRKLARGDSPSQADALHFHQLIYRRLVQGALHHKDAAECMLKRNNRTAPYLWVFTLLTATPAVLFWSNTPVLIAFCVLFGVVYVVTYISIVRFKAQRWLSR